MFRKYKLKFSNAILILTLCLSVLAITYARNIATENIAVTNNLASNLPVITLDAGHGGMDGGCSTADGKVEKNINLSILLSAKDFAEFFGYSVEATRTTDKSIHDKGVTGIRNQKVSDMNNRLAIFNQYPNSVCVSIHQNTFSDPKYSGAQMFYSDKNPDSEAFASIMQQSFVSYLQPENMRETKLCGDELFLCYYCENPAIMVECGFLSNEAEASLLTDKSYQKKVAFCIFGGINEFISIKT